MIPRREYVVRCVTCAWGGESGTPEGALILALHHTRQSAGCLIRGVHRKPPAGRTEPVSVPVTPEPPEPVDPRAATLARLLDDGDHAPSLKVLQRDRLRALLGRY